jgi:hypothetical protein
MVMVAGGTSLTFSIKDSYGLVGAGEGKLGEEFQLKINQTALIEPANVIVRFDGVLEDSRCPSDVICVWQGQVTIGVTIKKTDETTIQSFNLTVREGQRELAVQSFDGLSIRLASVEPYPTSQGIEASDYVATLVVAGEKGILEPVYVKLSEEFELVINQTAVIEPSNIKVRFDAITEDSRCPSDVVCIWEGQVTMRISIARTFDNVQALDLTLRGGEEALATKTWNGYSIKLLRVEPYPTSQGIEASDYVATLLVSADEELLSERVYIKAIGGREDGKRDYIYRFLGSLELSEKDGVLILMRDYTRNVWRVSPAAISCGDMIDSDRCIEASISDERSATKSVLIGINEEKMTLVVTTEGDGEKKIRFDIREVKTSFNGAVKERSVIALSEGQREGPLLIKEIRSDRVVGLNFPEYPVAMDRGMPIELHVGDSASNGCTITLRLVGIQEKTATFLKSVNTDKICPICWHDKQS